MVILKQYTNRIACVDLLCQVWMQGSKGYTELQVIKVLRVEVQMAGTWCVRRMMMVVIEFSSC